MELYMSKNKNFSYYLKQTGLTIETISEFLGVSHRTIQRWESSEIEPKKIYLEQTKMLAEKIASNAQFKNSQNPTFKFIDLFAGIGGIRIPFQEMGGECVFTSEMDKFAKKTYAANFGEVPDGDITQIPASEIPEHDVLLAGFPCQAFSQAGLKQGFMDTRGTMFFEIQRILAYHRPRAFLLENVKQLKGHDKGRTLKTIVDILQGKSVPDIPNDIPMSEEARKSLGERLNYWVDFKVLRAPDYGVPQNRERVYIVGFDKDYFKDVNFDWEFKWPEPTAEKTRLGDILFHNSQVDDKYTISDKLWAGHQRRKIEHKTKGNGFGYGLFNRESPYANTISARYYKDGSEILIDQSDLGKNPRKLTPRECARLQGFPENFIVDSVSDGQAYKQFGNSVAVPVIRAVADAMSEVMGLRNKAANQAKAA
jgi:DNA (cytosine-5)-methyltransferase 1